MKHQRRIFTLASVLAIAASSMGQSVSTNWIPVQMDQPTGMRSALPMGAKASTDVLHISVALPFADPAGISNFVESVSNPNSPNYRQFLTPDQVGSRFGLPASSLAKVTAYLKSCGMNVHLIGKNRLSILADATVAQAQVAFNTSIEEFFPLNTNVPAGSKLFSYTTPPNLPSSISGYVNYIGGLENFTRPVAHNTLTPAQIQTLYGLKSITGAGSNGQGRTVAISNFDGYRLNNIPLEYNQFSLPTPSGGAGSNVTVVSIDGQNGNSSPAQGEGDIDIQTVLSMAPLCNFMIYDNGAQNDLVGVLTKEADDNLADVISESYGWSGNSAFYSACHNIHVSMSAQGITYLAAAGDSGTSSLEGSSAKPYPDMDPEVLIVGGTSVTFDNSGNRLSEVVWSNNFGSGGGGWFPSSDPFNVLPSYQKGTGVPTSIPYRLSPDVSLDADPNTGYEIYQNGSLQPGWGGTSCASPTLAGSLADCEEQIIAGGGLTANSAGKRRFGRINNLLYSYNGDPTVFHDITLGSNGTLPNGANSNAGPGWDTASGWGTMIFSGLVNRVLSLEVASSVSVTPTSVVGGNSSQGVVYISSAAPSSGQTVTLKSSSTAVTVPASVTILAGKTSVQFTVTTAATSTTISCTISATAGGQTVTSAFSVMPPGISNFAVSPGSVIGGNNSEGNLTINGVAPAGGLSVKLSSSNASPTVPSTVIVPAGTTSTTFKVSSAAVSKVTTAIITAKYGTSSVVSSLTIEPTSLSTVSVSPGSVLGSISATGTITLNGKAPASGLTVTLSSSTSNATVPASVKVPGGATSTTFKISTKAVSSTVNAAVTAKSASVTETTSLAITAPSIVSVVVSPISVVGGSKTSVSGTVTISGPAPSTGLTVSLSSSNTGAASVPTTVKIASGAKTAKFTITTKAVAATTSVSVTGTTGAGSQQGTLTVKV